MEFGSFSKRHEMEESNKRVMGESNPPTRATLEEVDSSEHVCIAIVIHKII
jgi:hypothetical protein